MQPDNKHKIFSKEELFKLLDEKKSLPPEADDFDKEALEGLSMLKDRKKVDGLNNSIDEVLRKEKTKAKKRKSLYFLSAAASLILIVGLFFILKDDSFTKKESVLAENSKPADNTISKADQPKALEESEPDEKKLSDQSVNSPATTTGEANLKEEKKLDSEITIESNKGLGAGDVMAVPPPTEAADKAQTKSENGKVTTEDADAENNERSRGGKDYKTSLAKDDQQKSNPSPEENTKKTDGIIDDKEKEKDKTKYVTNTVWTSTPAGGAGGVADESKNKSDDYRSKSQDSKDGNSVAANNANVSIQKNGEVAAYEKQSSKGPEKKSKSNKGEAAKPDTIVTDMLAGYSYYDKKPEKGIVQGGEPQTTQPVQTQNELSTSSTIAQNQAADIPAEQKPAQEVSGKEGSKHESQPDTKGAGMKNAELQSPARGNATLESAEFKGGTEALQQYINKNLKISTPQKTGTIVAEFVVSKEGNIDTATVKITTKIKDCDPCSKDVKQLVKTMPKWRPATEKGKTISHKAKISVKYNADAAK